MEALGIRACTERSEVLRGPKVKSMEGWKERMERKGSKGRIDVNGLGQRLKGVNFTVIKKRRSNFQRDLQTDRYFCNQWLHLPSNEGKGGMYDA